jgi:hypothetical protein
MRPQSRRLLFPLVKIDTVASPAVGGGVGVGGRRWPAAPDGIVEA